MDIKEAIDAASLVVRMVSETAFQIASSTRQRMRSLFLLKKPARIAMPASTAWIDALRAAFGNDDINEQIRRGVSGEPVFWASENGQEIGTKPPDHLSVWALDGLSLRLYCPGCHGECVGTERQCRARRNF